MSPVLVLLEQTIARRSSANELRRLRRFLLHIFGDHSRYLVAKSLGLEGERSDLHHCCICEKADELEKARCKFNDL